MCVREQCLRSIFATILNAYSCEKYSLRDPRAVELRHRVPTKSEPLSKHLDASGSVRSGASRNHVHLVRPFYRREPHSKPVSSRRRTACSAMPQTLALTAAHNPRVCASSPEHVTLAFRHGC